MYPVHRDILLSYAALSPISTLGVLPLDQNLVAPYPLHDYQLDIILEVIRLMGLGYRRILIVLPTGGGKTHLAKALLGIARDLGCLSQFVVHRRELLKQTSKTFSSSGIEHGFIASGWPMDAEAAVILAGVQTLVRRLSLTLPPDLIVLDEAHHATAGTWERMLSYYADSFVVGLTATPERLDGRGLDEHFEVMVRGPSIADLIEWGYLSPFDYYAPHIPDMTGVASVGGDFTRGGAAGVMDRPKLIGDIVEHYLTLAAGQQGIGFAVSREHSRKIVDAFRAHGVRAVHVDGDTDDDERERADEMFRAGDIDIISNVDLLGEGYDVPGAVYLGDWAPSKSFTKVAQRRGRVLRTAAGKGRAIMADHAGNALPTSLGGQGHGSPDDHHEWSLEGRASRLRAASAPSDAKPVRQCRECYRVEWSTVPICPGCGTPFPSMVREIEQKDGKLTKLERDAVKAAEREAVARAREQAKQQKEAERQAAALALKTEKRECKTFADFEALALRQGYENPEGWARMQMNFKRNYRRRG